MCTHRHTRARTQFHSGREQMQSAGSKQITCSTDSEWLMLKGISLGFNVADVITLPTPAWTFRASHRRDVHRARAGRLNKNTRQKP